MYEGESIIICIVGIFFCGWLHCWLGMMQSTCVYPNTVM